MLQASKTSSLDTVNPVHTLNKNRVQWQEFSTINYRRRRDDPDVNHCCKRGSPRSPGDTFPASGTLSYPQQEQFSKLFAPLGGPSLGVRCSRCTTLALPSAILVFFSGTWTGRSPGRCRKEKEREREMEDEGPLFSTAKWSLSSTPTKGSLCLSYTFE